MLVEAKQKIDRRKNPLACFTRPRRPKHTEQAHGIKSEHASRSVFVHCLSLTLSLTSMFVLKQQLGLLETLSLFHTRFLS